MDGSHKTGFLWDVHHVDKSNKWEMFKLNSSEINTDYGKMTFAFTIRNQYTSGFATIKAAVENKAFLRKYQQTFFKTAISQKAKTGFAGYEFGDDYDMNRNKAFIEQLLSLIKDDFL